MITDINAGHTAIKILCEIIRNSPMILTLTISYYAKGIIHKRKKCKIDLSNPGAFIS